MYPDSTDYMLMHRIDSVLEISNEFLHSYIPFTVATFPTYAQRDILEPKWFAESLPTYL